MAGREDLYIVLEVNRRASVNEIKAAYKRLARVRHPDLNGGSAESAQAFVQISRARDILIDPKRRAGQGSGRTSRPRHSTGRWALLYTDQTAERNRTVEATCWMLLRRYGIVFRDILARETNLPTWRELLIAFRRLEDRGEIRGGRFIDGFLGEQFALPIAVESVRAMRKLPPTGETITTAAADPLNLVGILVPGDRVPAISGKTVSFRDGVAEQPASVTKPELVALESAG